VPSSTWVVEPHLGLLEAMSSCQVLGLQVTLRYALQFPYGRHLDVSRFHGEKGLGPNPLLRGIK
jgi:hypothetical protein